MRVVAEGHVTTVVIDNPRATNACTGDMWVALGATFRDPAQPGTRAIILTGAGGELCAGADVVPARFSAIFATRGLSLDFGTWWLLCQRVGIHKAKGITFAGRVFGASEALALGMVNTVVPTDQLANAGQTSLAQALETEALAQSVNAQSDDMREALMAYAERRPANFSGT
jgi:2-(1,2-epoxy-1,2-dihydrophenyl)acetyl-CoA isomerase